MCCAGLQPIHVPSLRVFQGAATVAFNDDEMWDVAGDIKVEVYRQELRAKQLLCYAWLNTTCLSCDAGGQAQVKLPHQELDKVDEACPRNLALHLRLQARNGAERPGRAHHPHAMPLHCSLPSKPGHSSPLEQLSSSGSEGSEGSACLRSPTPGTMQSVQVQPGHQLSSGGSPPPSPTAIQASRPVPSLFPPGSFLSLLEAGSKAHNTLPHSARPAWDKPLRAKAPRRHWSELFGAARRPEWQHTRPGGDPCCSWTIAHRFCWCWHNPSLDVPASGLLWLQGLQAYPSPACDQSASDKTCQNPATDLPALTLPMGNDSLAGCRDGACPPAGGGGGGGGDRGLSFIMLGGAPACLERCCQQKQKVFLSSTSSR